MSELWADELSVKCPLHECSRPAGQMCVYVTAQDGCGHEMGQKTQVPHRERRRVGRILRDRRADRQRMEQLADKVLRAGPVRDARNYSRLAVLGFNPEEREALRAWLTEFGPVLWQDPDPVWSGLRITLTCGHVNLVERPRKPEHAALYVIGASAACWVCPVRRRAGGGQVAAVRQIADVTGITAPREPESLEPIHWYWEGQGY